MTPYGGLAVIVEFWRERLPFVYRSRPTRSVRPRSLCSFGCQSAPGRGVSNVNLLRGDAALWELLGWRRLPRDDAMLAATAATRCCI